MAAVMLSFIPRFNVLRGARVLREINGYRIPQKYGAVAVLCPDCDRFYRTFRHLVRLQKHHRRGCRIHPITRNGGPLRLVANSRTNRRGRTTARDLYDEIKESLLLKRINVVILCVHMPCSKAGLARMSFDDIIRELFEAKTLAKRLRRAIPGLKVVGLCHIDFGSRYRKLKKHRRQLTYFVSRTMWRRLLRRERSKLQRTTRSIAA